MCPSTAASSVETWVREKSPFAEAPPRSDEQERETDEQHDRRALSRRFLYGVFHGCIGYGFVFDCRVAIAI